MLKLNSNEKFVLQSLSAFDVEEIPNADGQATYQVEGPSWYSAVQHYTGTSPIGARTITAFMEKKGLVKVHRTSKKKPVSHITLTADAWFLHNQISVKGHGDWTELLPSGRWVVLEHSGRGSL